MRSRTLTWPPSQPLRDPHLLPRLLTTRKDPGLDTHLDRFGPLVCPPRELIEEVGSAGLRGRGGAGFPTAVKMGAVAARRNPVVVANGTEGEPASAKDKVLLTTAPHLVLDGAVAAARAVGADEVFICVDRRATAAIRSVSDAVAERRRTGIDALPIQVATTPKRYLTGEESALVRWLNGGVAKPTVTPPRPFERGFDKRPTLVQNVETLAHVGLIARFGGDWFRGIGTAEDPGSVLLTLGGAVARPGVIEAALGSRMVDVVAAAGGNLPETEAVLLGGYFGTWVPSHAAATCRLGVDDLRGIGAGIGCGVVAVLPARVCGLAETARITRWLAEQSAGQCGPCFNGLPAIAGAVDTLVAGDRHQRAEKQLVRWLAMVDGRGACHHPDGVVRLVRSALSVFATDVVEHRRRGPCRRTPPLLPTPSTDGWR